MYAIAEEVVLEYFPSSFCYWFCFALALGSQGFPEALIVEIYSFQVCCLI